ncbi:DUF6053 domain-containing protein [Lysobacter enzymogenes]|uniref:DUF6053 domain-containing protein n=1 Tax=Lysobacter enzymogenes TaxID=69 RepID=UPI003D18C09F
MCGASLRTALIGSGGFAVIRAGSVGPEGPPTKATRAGMCGAALRKALIGLGGFAVI